MRHNRHPRPMVLTSVVILLGYLADPGTVMASTSYYIDSVDGTEHQYGYVAGVRLARLHQHQRQDA